MEADNVGVVVAGAPHAAEEHGVAEAGEHAGLEQPEESPGRASFRELQALDSGAREEDYRGGLAGGPWDTTALAEDIQLTRECGTIALEEALAPLRAEMKPLTEREATLQAGEPAVLSVGRVILGDRLVATDAQRVRELGVQCVVNCSPISVDTGKEFYGGSVGYLELWQDDFLDYCVLQDFEAVWDFAERGGCCLFHCEQGVNRSGALAIAVLMKVEALRRPTAPPLTIMGDVWRHVASIKGRVLTNPGFQRQLLLFAWHGYQWLPSLSAVWRTPTEQRMAKFREAALAVAQRKMRLHARKGLLQDHLDARGMWGLVVKVRDAAMRGEMRMPVDQEPWGTGAQSQAEKRVGRYAERCLKRARGEDVAGVAGVPGGPAAPGGTLPGAPGAEPQWQ